MAGLSIPNGGLAVPILAQAVGQHRKAGQTDRQYETGLTAFENGDYQAALEAFEKAYKNSGKAEILYHIALTYKNLEEYRQAIKTFRRYLDENPEAPDRVLVSEEIKQIEDFLVESPPGPDQPPGPIPPPPPGLVGNRGGSYAPEVRRSPSQTAGGITWRQLMWVGVGLSSVSALVAGVFYSRGKEKEAERAELVARLQGMEAVRRDGNDLRWASPQSKLLYSEEINAIDRKMDRDQTIIIGSLAGAAVFAGLGVLFHTLDRKDPNFRFQFNLFSNSPGAVFGIDY